MDSRGLESSHIPLMPDPNRDKTLFASYSKEFNGSARRILINNDHPEMKTILESLDPKNVPSSSVLRDENKGKVRIVSIDGYGNVVIKQVQPPDFPGQQKSDFLEENKQKSTIRDLLEQQQRARSELHSKRIEEIALNWEAQSIGGLSLIKQLTIGKQVAREFEARFGEPLRVEEPLGAIVTSNGEKYIIYQYYEGKDLPELDGERRLEYERFEDDLHEKLYQLGYGFTDLQFLVLDDNKPIDLANIVIIDTEFLVPLVSIADEYKGRRENIRYGEYNSRPAKKK